MNEQDIATLMGFPSVEAMTKHQEQIEQQLREAAEIQQLVTALRQLQSTGNQFFGFAGQDLLCDSNYRVSLVIGLTSEGFVTTAVLCGGYPPDIPLYERDRNSNLVMINFPPGTDLDRDTDTFPHQNIISNNETGGWVKFGDPNLTHYGWQADIDIKFKDPDDDEAIEHTEAIIVDERTLGFWPQFLATVVH